MASLIGKEIGKYRITERIGRGGMAEVYLGTHILLDRPVAIKVLHGFLLEGGGFIERFKREAKAVANLRHPNIVQVFDFDIQDELIFMVMEYIDGTNLQKELVELCERGERFPITKIGPVIHDIASALDYAHSQGMLHRDVKPSNILIDKEGHAYLTDFGIARIVGDQRLTATGTLMGTPAYMSPEQGRGEELTEESDIYSLGIIAFELLTGHIPYDAKTPIGIIQKQISEPIPDITKIVSGVPTSAQEVIDRALAKSPEVRYSSADELVVALRIALDALESSNLVTKVPEGIEADSEELRASTVIIEEETEPPEPVKSTVVMEEEPEASDLGKATVVMEEEPEASDLGKTTAVMEEDETPELDIEPEKPDFGKATILMDEEEAHEPEEAPEFEEGSEPEEEPGMETEVEPEREAEVVPVKEGEPKAGRQGKIPIWGWIAGGVVLVGIVAAVVLTQGIGSPVDDKTKATQTSRATTFEQAAIQEEPTSALDIVQDSVELTFSAHMQEAGLRLLSGHNMDTKVIMQGEEQAWRTGNGQIMPSDDYNEVPDNNMWFDIDDKQIFRVPSGALVSIEVQYTDSGTDSFGIDYDAQSGDLYGVASIKGTGPVQKTDSGDIRTIEFYLEDAYFGNRMEGADFTIADNEDGPETIWMVNLKLYKTMSGEEYYKVGDSLMIEENYSLAVEFYKLAVENGYETVDLYYQQAQAYRSLEKYEEALSAFDLGINISPNDAYMHADKGELLWDYFGDAEGALNEFDLAVMNAGNDPNVIWQRGRFFLETGQYDQCIEDFSTVISMDPNNSWSPLKRGDCYAGLGDTASAKQDYETFLNMTEGESGWDEQRQRAQTYLDENVFGADGVVLDADHTDHGLTLADSYDQDVEIITVGEDQVQAWRTGNRQVLPSPDNNDTGDDYMAFYIDDNYIYEISDKSMVRILVEYLDEGFDRFVIQYDALAGGPFGSGIFKDSDEVKKANTGEFKTAEFILTDAYMGNRNNGQDFRLDDRADGAETIRSVTVTAFPLLEAEECYHMAENLLGQGDDLMAIEYYNLAAAGGYISASLYTGKAIALANLGKYETALASLDKALDFDPNDPRIRQVRGDCFAELDQIDYAKHEYETFLNMIGDDQGWESERDRAQTYLDTH